MPGEDTRDQEIPPEAAVAEPLAYFVGFSERPDPYEKLPALAKRLGVEPVVKGTAAVILTTRDGQAYSLMDLVNAFLDRLDEGSRRVESNDG